MRQISIIIVLLITTTFSFGQSLDSIKANQENVWTEISKKIKENYIFPDIAIITDSIMTAQIKSGIFNNLTNKEFATSLTTSLRTITNDKHFFVKYLSNFTPEVSAKMTKSSKN